MKSAVACKIQVIIYFPSLHFPFFAEDYNYIYQAKNNFNAYETFISQFLGTKISGNFFYRPLTRDVLFSIAYNLFQLSPLGYRLVIFLLFLLSNFLVYAIAHSLTKRRDAALFAAFIYASRTAHFNSINWITAGFQAYGMLVFMLASVFSYLLFAQRGKKIFYLISILSFFMALLSKETCFVLPLLIILIELAAGGKKIKATVFRTLPFMLLDLLFVIRFLMLRATAPGFYENSFSAGLILQNVKSFILNSFNNSLEAATLGLMLLLITPLVFRARKGLVLVAVGWFVAGLLPFLTLTSAALKNNEYYLDVSLVGFALLCALCVVYYQGKYYFSRYAVTPVLCIIIFLSAFDYNRDKVNQRYLNQKTYTNLLTHLTAGFPRFPDGTLLYFKGDEIDKVYWLSGNGDAIRLYYDNALVYFEGRETALPPGYSQIYFIELTGGTVRVSGPAQKDPRG